MVILLALLKFQKIAQVRKKLQIKIFPSSAQRGLRNKLILQVHIIF